MRPNLTPTVSPKYLFDETKIYIFVNRIPREVYRILGGFFKIFIFPTLGRYLQTSALNPPKVTLFSKLYTNIAFFT